MLAQAQVLLAHAVARIPGEALVDPTLVPLLVRSRHDEKFDLHLLELAGAESKIARRDLVTERFADLGDAEGELHAHGLEHVVEVDEDALGGLRSQVSN